MLSNVKWSDSGTKNFSRAESLSSALSGGLKKTEGTDSILTIVNTSLAQPNWLPMSNILANGGSRGNSTIFLPAQNCVIVAVQMQFFSYTWTDFLGVMTHISEVIMCNKECLRLSALLAIWGGKRICHSFTNGWPIKAKSFILQEYGLDKWDGIWVEFQCKWNSSWWHQGMQSNQYNSTQKRAIQTYMDSANFVAQLATPWCTSALLCRLLRSLSFCFSRLFKPRFLH